MGEQATSAAELRKRHSAHAQLRRAGHQVGTPHLTPSSTSCLAMPHSSCTILPFLSPALLVFLSFLFHYCPPLIQSSTNLHSIQLIITPLHHPAFPLSLFLLHSLSLLLSHVPPSLSLCSASQILTLLTSPRLSLSCFTCTLHLTTFNYRSPYLFPYITGSQGLRYSKSQMYKVTGSRSQRFSVTGCLSHWFFVTGFQRLLRTSDYENQ